MDAIGTDAIGTMGTLYWVAGDPRANELSKKFEIAFEKRYNHVPSHGEAIGYRAIQIVAEALRLAKGDYSAHSLANALNAVDIETMMGSAKFGPCHLMEANCLMLKAVASGNSYKVVSVKGYLTGVKEVGGKFVEYIIKEY